jgi:hypothetical protein
MCEVSFTAGGLGTNLRTFAQHNVLKRQGKICALNFTANTHFLTGHIYSGEEQSARGKLPALRWNHGPWERRSALSDQLRQKNVGAS